MGSRRSWPLAPTAAAVVSLPIMAPRFVPWPQAKAWKTAGRAGFHPGDVVADGPDFPAGILRGRNEHGEICFAACAREGGGDVGFFAFGRFDAEDEHVFGHPTFMAREVGADAEGEAFF